MSRIDPLRPRKLPVQARARATHDAIIEAAAQIVRAGGLSAFTTNAVAERAGVSIGSLYQYFPNKAALMVALIARQQARQRAAFRAALTTGDDEGLAALVRRLVRAAMQHHHEDALLAAAIDHEEARLPAAAFGAETLDEASAALPGILGRYASELDGYDPARAARTLPAMVRAVVDAWANVVPPQVETAEDEAVRAVLGYLGAGARKGACRE